MESFMWDSGAGRGRWPGQERVWPVEVERVFVDESAVIDGDPGLKSYRVTARLRLPDGDVETAPLIVYDDIPAYGACVNVRWTTRDCRQAMRSCERVLELAIPRQLKLLVNGAAVETGTLELGVGDSVVNLSRARPGRARDARLAATIAGGVEGKRLTGRR